MTAKKIVTTQTQPQLNWKVGCDTQMTFHHPPPPQGTQRQQYLTSSWPHFNQTFGVLEKQLQNEQQ